MCNNFCTTVDLVGIFAILLSLCLLIVNFKLMANKLDARIVIRAASNTRTLTSVDPQRQQFYQNARRKFSSTYMRRTATQDTQLGDQKIGEGEKVVMYYPAANRDPAKFANPNTFDIDRANAKEHLSFGQGPHVCLGQRVANMQLEAAYRRILARFPKVRWTGEQTIAPNNFVHAISSLMVDLGI